MDILQGCTELVALTKIPLAISYTTHCWVNNTDNGSSEGGFDGEAHPKADLPFYLQLCEEPLYL